jgi:hypothetical protein
MSDVRIPHLDGLTLPAHATITGCLGAFVHVRRQGLEFRAMLCPADRPDTDHTVCLLEYFDDPAMRAVQTYVAAQIVAHTSRPASAVLVLDSYVSTHALDDPPTVPPSENPEATEAILVIYATQAQAIHHLVLPYGYGEDGDIAWREPSGWNDMSSMVATALSAAVDEPKLDWSLWMRQASDLGVQVITSVKG